MAVSQASFAPADKVSHLGEDQDIHTLSDFLAAIILFLFCLGHEKSKPLYPDVSVVDKGNEVWIVGAHRGVQTSSACLRLDLVREQRP